MSLIGSAGKKAMSKRVVSLDVLRGFDLFFLFAVGPIFFSFYNGPLHEQIQNSAFWSQIPDQLSHAWDHFSAWDMIMPLFMFMAGVTIPFSLAKYTNRLNGRPTFGLLWRIFRRIVLLWFFGMVVQGNLLGLSMDGLRLYSNTLQAIAAGYLIAVIFYFLTGRIGQMVAIGVLVFGYWGAMKWGSGTDSYGLCGLGSYLQDTNFAEFIDRAVLGKWRDGVSFAEDGTWSFAAGYHYTWILSSLTFGVTTICGCLAGEIVKTGIKTTGTIPVEVPGEGTVEVPSVKPVPGYQIALQLLVAGLILTALGWGWGKIPEGTLGYCPIIKILWTPSMALYAAGISFLLLSLFYFVFDVLHLPLLGGFFQVIGVNSIFCYVIAHIISFSDIARRFLHGTEQYFGPYYDPAMQISGFLILWLILFFLYRNGKFLRV